MKQKVSRIQKRRIKEAVKMFKNYAADPECLFRIVTTLGPAFFGLVIETNAQTVWIRVENPKTFKYEEIERISHTFQISVVNFLEVIEKQAAYNFQERIHRRPIGQRKYYPHKYHVSEQEDP